MCTHLNNADIDFDHAQRIAEYYGLRVRTTPDDRCILDDPTHAGMRIEGTRDAVLSEFIKTYRGTADDFAEVVVKTAVPTCPHLLAAITAILSSDDQSTDAELIAHLVREFGISADAAAAHVRHRDEMLSGIPCVED